MWSENFLPKVSCVLGNTAALCKTCDSCPLQSQSETYIMLAMDS